MARTWTECVSSSREALVRLEDAQWTIGRDVLEAIPPGTSGVDQNITKVLRKYAAEVGVSYATLERWRSVALKFAALGNPPAGGLSIPWSAYRLIADRINDPEEACKFVEGLIANGVPGRGDRWTVAMIRPFLPPAPPKSSGSTPGKAPTTTGADASSGDESSDESEGSGQEGTPVSDLMARLRTAAASATSTPADDESAAARCARVREYIDGAREEVAGVGAANPEWAERVTEIDELLEEAGAVLATLTAAVAEATA